MTQAPVVATFEVVDSARVSEYHLLAIAAPPVAAAAEPGQFVSIAAEPGSRCILRRPFSIASARDGVIEVAFDAIGPGTTWLASRRPGDRVGVAGPLGTAFSTSTAGASAVLVGGGYGAAPMFFLAERLRPARGRVHLVLGAARRERLLDLGAHPADEVSVTTEDGSEGTRGRVTDVLPGIIDHERPGIVYACGPMPMLEAVAHVATRAGVPCEVAVEEFMACGIGVCWTCVLPVRTNGQVKHLRSCTEGPVFDGAAVAWG